MVYGNTPDKDISHLFVRQSLRSRKIQWKSRQTDAGRNSGVRLCDGDQILGTRIFLVPVLLPHFLEAQILVDPAG